jgi:hypothetical protein
MRTVWLQDNRLTTPDISNRLPNKNPGGRGRTFFSAELRDVKEIQQAGKFAGADQARQMEQLLCRCGTEPRMH